MLSTELTKRKDTCHLQSFLDRINAPHTLPKGSPEERKFRALVVERLEQQKVVEAKEISDKSIPSGPSSYANPPSKCCHTGRSGCSCFSCGTKSRSSDPDIIWRHIECKTFENFESYASASIACNLNIIRCLRAISQSLSFWEEPYPDWEGLSVLGCYGWILSFSLQHLMDEDNPRDQTLLTGLDEIRQLYTEMAQSAEIFVDMVEKFHEHCHRLRSDMLYTVKKLVHKWKLESHSPFLKRPEVPLNPPTHVLNNKKNNVLAEEAFHLNWTPLAVMIKSKKMSLSYHPFSTLIMSEKLHWFKVFAEQIVSSLELEAEDMTIIAGQLSCIHISDGSTTTPTTHTKSHARELSGALIHFSKISPSHKPPPTPHGDSSLVRLLSELWFSADIVHEESVKLLRLIHETRDILKTCYVYADIFYKFGLPSYDSFLVKEPHQNNFKRAKSQNVTNIKSAWDKFVGGDERKLSDIQEMLVMAEYSNSIYQQILQVRPVEADNMVMILESQGMNENLGCGLINGMPAKKVNKK